MCPLHIDDVDLRDASDWGERRMVLAAPIPRIGYSSRWTVSGENAGTQTATYSAPSASGVE